MNPVVDSGIACNLSSERHIRESQISLKEKEKNRSYLCVDGGDLSSILPAQKAIARVSYPDRHSQFWVPGMRTHSVMLVSSVSYSASMGEYRDRHLNTHGGVGARDVCRNAAFHLLLCLLFSWMGISCLPECVDCHI